MYCWGAAIILTGVLFKLTNLPFAKEMLFVGMVSEIVVFFFSAFDST
ncbi:MAG TPA: gliding motility protein GldL, partial [Porphyromonadaceae bacterium]|nr:gliding motility protein GldL [Porphyromonadaceae bacterium]